MSRSGYIDDYADQWVLIRWRGAVNAALRGKRGQAMLRELRAGLDALPNKRLIAGDLISPEGEYCALGVIAARRGLDVATVDPYDHETIAGMLNIADALAREVAYVNDEEGCITETPETRWQRVSRWVDGSLQDSAPTRK